ncbi:MAG: riboflavin kinase / FMN adenylyltransferase [Candidatus Peregrinibacteria bacterium Greene0416_19]|nr:MAG: riboflavin kinase / FMN adenylyltransferase [Candidatus Peregrinibacteria bacterium Greene0416_19]
MDMLPPAFTAHVIPGTAQGRVIGTPTINLDLAAIPSDIKEGVYAARARLPDEQEWSAASVHYGPRPVFQEGPSFEVHIIDRNIDVPPVTLEVALMEWLRPVQDFPSVEALKTQIEEDIEGSRAIAASREPGQP